MTYTSIATSRSRRASVFALLFAALIVCLSFGATRASAATFAPTFDQTLSSPSAGTATGLTATITKNASASNFKQIAISESPQLSLNFAAYGSAVDQCPSASMPSTTSVFNPASCPAQAKVGTITITSPTYSRAATGNVYLIAKSPVPWLGVDINPASAAGNPAGLTARFAFVGMLAFVDPACNPDTDPSGFCQQQLRYTSAQLPNIKLSKIVLNLNGPNRAGSSGVLSGKLFSLVTAPCVSPIVTKAVFTPVSGTAKTVTDTDAISGCGPKFNQTFANPTAGASTSAVWDWDYASQATNLKNLEIKESKDVGLNFAAVGSPTTLCPSSAMASGVSTFDASSCPASAKAGSFTINSPAYSGPATGDVYLINKSPIPWIGIDIKPTTAVGNPAGLNLAIGFAGGLQNVSATCNPDTEPSGFCQQQIRFQANNLPDVAIASAKLTFSRALFTLNSADGACASPFTTTGNFYSYANVITPFVDADSVSGCA